MYLSKQQADYRKKAIWHMNLSLKWVRIPRQVLLQFIDRIPEDKLKPLIEFSLKLSSVQNELKNLKKDLSADQKVELGIKLKTITEGFTKIIEDLSE